MSKKKEIITFSNEKFIGYVINRLGQYGIKFNEELWKLSNGYYGFKISDGFGSHYKGSVIFTDAALPIKTLGKYVLNLNNDYDLWLSFGEERKILHDENESWDGGAICIKGLLDQGDDLWYLRLRRFTEGEYKDPIDVWRCNIRPGGSVVDEIVSLDSKVKLFDKLKQRLEIKEGTCLADAIPKIADFYKSLR